MKDYPVMGRSSENTWYERDYYVVPDRKTLSRMANAAEYLALTCTACKGKIEPTQKYTRSGGLRHLNCPPAPVIEKT